MSDLQEISVGGQQPPISHDVRDRAVQPGDGVVEPRLTAMQQTARTLLLGILVVVFLLSVLILWSWLFGGPAFPDTSDEARLKVWTQLQQTHHQAHREMFQTVVAAGFLPLATALLGYLFGVQSQQK